MSVYYNKFCNGSKLVYKKIIVLILCVNLTLLSLLNVYGAYNNSFTTGASSNTAVISVELFTIGCGYLLEPTVVDVSNDTTIAQAVINTLHSAGYAVYYSGTVNDRFYLAYVGSGTKSTRYNGYNNSNKLLGIPSNSKELNINPVISDFLCQKLSSTMRFFYKDDAQNYKGYIGELMFTEGGGFLYSVNNAFTSNGMSAVKLQKGDVVRVQYSLCSGADIGGLSHGLGGGLTDNFYETANKDKLTNTIALINSNKNLLTNSEIKSAYNNAVKAIEKPDATQSEIDSSFLALQQAINNTQGSNQSGSSNNTSSLNNSSNSQTLNDVPSNNTSSNSGTQNVSSNNNNTTKNPTTGDIQNTTSAKATDGTTATSQIDKQVNQNVESTTQALANASADQSNTNNANITFLVIVCVAIILVVTAFFTMFFLNKRKKDGKKK